MSNTDKYQTSSTICPNPNCHEAYAYFYPLMDTHPAYDRLKDMVYGALGFDEQQDVKIGICPNCNWAKWLNEDFIMDQFAYKAQMRLNQRRKDELRNA